MSRSIRTLFVAATLSLALVPSVALGAQTTATGGNAAAVQAAVDAFRATLGEPNNGAGATATSGRREINWDGTPDARSAPFGLPGNFFNVNSPRGLVMSTSAGGFMVSAKSVNPTNTPVEFNNLDPAYEPQFIPFSAERLFAAPASTTTDVSFFVPNTTTPATVRGFGAIFTDVDAAGTTSILACDAGGNVLETVSIPPTASGISFGEIHMTSASIASVRIIAGTTPMMPAAGAVDSATGDIVAMDDFFYGEPVAAQSAPIVACGALTPAPKVVLDRGRVEIRRGIRFPFDIACPAEPTIGCTGRLTIRWQNRIIAATNYRLAAGRIAHLNVRLNAVGQALYRRQSSANVRVTATNRPTGFSTSTSSVLVRAVD